MDRGERRARTERVCEARLRLKRQDCYYWDKESWEDYKERWGLTPFRYAKDHPRSCRCSKKTHGRPKVGHGICNCGYRYRVLGLRHVARKLRDLSRLHLVDWESDESVLLAEGTPANCW